MTKKNSTLEEAINDALVPTEEHPYKIPDNWIWTKIGGIIEVKSSKRVFKNEYVKQGIPFYRSKEITELSKGLEISNNLYITSEKYLEISEKTTLPRKNDILMTSVGTIGNSWIVDNREFYYKDGNITQLCNNNSINMNYVNHFLSSNYFIEQTNSIISGSAYNALTITKIKKLLIPVPPLPEQQLIVAHIKSLFEKIDKAQTLIEEAREGFEKRKEAILVKAFRGELTEKWREENPNIVNFSNNNLKQSKTKELNKSLPKSWSFVKIKEVIIKMKTIKPTSLNKKHFHYIDIDSIDNKKHVIRELKVLEVDKAPSRARRSIKKNDVLISLVRPYLKNIAINEYDDNDIIASTGFYVCKSNKLYNPKLLYYYFISDYFTNKLTKLMKGDNSPSIRTSEFPIQEIPLIPIEEQYEIVRLLDLLLDEEEKINNLTSLNSEIQIIKKSIFAKAFRGELGTNNPSEESAIKLLEEVINNKLN